MRRRSLILGVTVGALAAPTASLSPWNAQAHTLYGQWVVYRKKHLLIGCHRKDPLTFDLAKRIEAEFTHALPEAKARVARAPHPERLASLLGTDQLEIAVLAIAEAEAMAAGTGEFAPYGRQPLTLLADLQSAAVGLADLQSTPVGLSGPHQRLFDRAWRFS